jgi:hypothetical protein
MDPVKVHLLVPLATLAIAVPTALAWPGRPATPPPAPPNDGAPPPAWIETQKTSAWLAYGSYCWKTSCVDMIPPNSRPDLPTFSVKRGATVRVHLGFAAKSVSVSIGTKAIRARLDRAKRIASWSATRGGIVTVFARTGGDASYVVRLRHR